MKKFLLLMAAAGFITACNNSADTARSEKDSLDSVANAQKNAIDSAAQERMDRIDSVTQEKKDLIDSTNRNDTSRQNNR